MDPNEEYVVSLLAVCICACLKHGLDVDHMVRAATIIAEEDMEDSSPTPMLEAA